MKKMIALALLFVIGMQVYDVMRPTEIVMKSHIVKAGDTMYGIANKYYITKDNTECFNEFWHRMMKENGKTSIDIGDIVWISNKVYK